MIKKIWGDFWGLWRICGASVALRWLGAAVVRLPRVIRERNLSAADLAMGEGPYRARFSRSSVKLHGFKVIAHIRELWVRDVYRLADLPSNGLVLDLGANRGYFTAAAAARGNRVVAVEASRVGVRAIEELCQLNGWRTVETCNVFVGGKTDRQNDDVCIPDHEGVPFITEQELLDRHGITRIDFLKCDIEGSEFGLLGPRSKLLDITDRIAIEVHYHAGSREDMIRNLRAKGFEVGVQSEAADGCILAARRLPAAP